MRGLLQRIDCRGGADRLAAEHELEGMFTLKDEAVRAALRCAAISAGDFAFSVAPCRYSNFFNPLRCCCC